MTGRPALILNVDDNEAVRYVKGRTLRHAGFEVVDAATGGEALSKVASERPDLILLDVKLPDISGHEVCRRVKAGYPRVMVLQTSASFVTSQDRVIGLEGGADAYLTQPVEPAELVASVRALLRIRAAEDGLYEAQSRLDFALTDAQMVGWEWDVEADDIRPAGDVEGLFGRSFEQLAAFLACVHADDRARVRDGIVAARDGHGDLRHEFRIVRPDGRIGWVLQRARRRRTPGGATVLSGVLADITERKDGEERQRLLAREVDHRAKNALMVVQSILRMTKADDPAAYVAAVEGRVSAMARAHTVLARENWAGGGLRELLEAELGAYLPNDSITLSGPDVRILPLGVQPLSLVLHELVTNAAKYGALSCPGGTLEIAWRLDDAGDLRLHWRETCRGAAVLPPERRGFGSQLIDGTVRKQLGGDISRDWQPSGLVCTSKIAGDLLDRGAPRPAPEPGDGHEHHPTGGQCRPMMANRRT